MTQKRFAFIDTALARAFPEQRLFLRSDRETRFIRLSPATQLVALSGSALVVGWSIVASAILLMDTIGAGSVREQTQREQILYEDRLNVLSQERENALHQAGDAHERFNAALSQVSDMQAALLDSELRRHELERGIEVTQDTLRRTLKERDMARAAQAELAGQDGAAADAAAGAEDLASTLDMLSAALDATSGQRDAMAHEAAEAERFVEEMMHKARLAEQRNDEIFTKLEDALSVSVEPLDKMFRKAGLDSESLLATVRRGYSGLGGPLTPMSFSTKGQAPDANSMRTNSILEKLDKMNLYRIAAQKSPFAVPIKDSFRFTSGFGPRWGRMHNGTDFAASLGTPIYSTADGVVIHSGWSSGFGKLVKIQHEFGIQTYYAHQSKLRVKKGQRVSRGERIGDMGSTGRSTGVHLHYEVRVDGKPVNPMTYIKAAKDVF
ncbi:M23 family metallopeptidase [Profundibacterium mesophilum]|uniref:Lipoprotein NlpD n=1 Tax=Profundibacterium mesophilum KAUST100406-0324 TaxID=1037889 RepID=A0A921NTE1_9RHOB|nr:M23 family metallopeptidase [Profundibacterium mesophilum]KAF0677627.1 Lipoprotein NlpD [Profundibacterium mesophilum KAUST100406-0324]